MKTKTLKMLKKREKTMKNSVICIRAVLLASLLAVGFWGCNRGPSLAEIEERERASRLYTNAMDDLQAGRLEAAIKGFEKVVMQEPKSYSAHFQLATLLQDVRKDYISAIAHYRDYLALRPASDKATVAQDRVKLCETLLSAEIVRKAGGSASNKLVADNEKLTAARDQLAAQVKKLESELEKSQREVKRLEAENASKSRFIEKLSAAVEGTPTAKRGDLKGMLAALKDERENVERRRLNPSDADLLDDDGDSSKPDLRAGAQLKGIKEELARLDAEDKPVSVASAAAAAANSVKVANVDPPPAAGKSPKDKTPAAKPRPGLVASGSPTDSLFGSRRGKDATTLRPETYTVQDGDTLFKISHRFYGSSRMWRQIQDANKGIIPADGRVRAGQTLKLP